MGAATISAWTNNGKRHAGHLARAARKQHEAAGQVLDVFSDYATLCSRSPSHSPSLPSLTTYT